MTLYRDQLDPSDFDTPEDFAKAQQNAVPRPKDTCIRCNHPMTWAAQCAQYGRLLRRGFSSEAAKQLMPHCQTCMTITLQAAPNPKKIPVQI